LATVVEAIGAAAVDSAPSALPSPLMESPPTAEGAGTTWIVNSFGVPAALSESPPPQQQKIPPPPPPLFFTDGGALGLRGGRASGEGSSLLAAAAVLTARPSTL
jgi:hypothetical protein